MTLKEQNRIIDLWMQFLDGDEEAFAQMYCLFFDELLMYGCRVGGNSDMVEDQIQDLFIKLYQKQIVLTDNNKLRPFLFRSLKNRIYNQLLRDARLCSLPDYEFKFDLQYTIDEQLSQIHDRGLSDEVMYLLRGLTERQKEIIYFRFVNDMSFEEISEVMEVTIQSARNLLTRSLVKIRKESLLLFLLLESIPYTV